MGGSVFQAATPAKRTSTLSRIPLNDKPRGTVLLQHRGGRPTFVKRADDAIAASAPPGPWTRGTVRAFSLLGQHPIKPIIRILPQKDPRKPISDGFGRVEALQIVRSFADVFPVGAAITTLTDGGKRIVRIMG